MTLILKCLRVLLHFIFVVHNVNRTYSPDRW